MINPFHLTWTDVGLCGKNVWAFVRSHKCSPTLNQPSKEEVALECSEPMNKTNSQQLRQTTEQFFLAVEPPEVVGSVPLPFISCVSVSWQ